MDKAAMLHNLMVVRSTIKIIANANGILEWYSVQHMYYML